MMKKKTNYLLPKAFPDWDSWKLPGNMACGAVRFRTVTRRSCDSIHHSQHAAPAWAKAPHLKEVVELVVLHPSQASYD